MVSACRSREDLVLENLALRRQLLALHAQRPHRRATNPAVVQEIDRLLDHHTFQQIASILNARGLRSGEGKTFSVRIVARIQKRYGLMPRYDRLRKAGMVTVKEMAALLGITPQWVKIWNRPVVSQRCKKLDFFSRKRLIPLAVAISTPLKSRPG